jgi:hypothetical protein
MICIKLAGGLAEMDLLSRERSAIGPGSRDGRGNGGWERG